MNLRFGLHLSLFVATVFIVALLHASPGRAADFLIEIVGVDGGATPPTTGSTNAAKYSNQEIAALCHNGDARLKVCETGSTCTAVATSGQYLQADKTYPICFPSGWGKASVIQSDTGTVLSCEFYQVNPKQTCPP